MDFCKEKDDIIYDTFASMHVREAAVPDELINTAAENADVAVITLSRFSAEGVDRKPIDSDYYLSFEEKSLIDRAAKAFKKTIVVLNSGAVVDCEHFADNDKVQGILFGWQGGLEGGAAVAISFAATSAPPASSPTPSPFHITHIRMPRNFSPALSTSTTTTISMSATATSRPYPAPPKECATRSASVFHTRILSSAAYFAARQTAKSSSPSMLRITAPCPARRPCSSITPLPKAYSQARKGACGLCQNSSAESR